MSHHRETVSPVRDTIAKTCAMTSVSLSFLGIFLLALLESQTLAKPTSSTSGNQSGPVGTQKCNNVYFYEAPNKKIESILQDVKTQLAHMQKDIDIIKEKKNATKGKTYAFLCAV